jgi:hypothetical protein
VAFTVVTMGPRATEYAQELFRSNEYRDYLHFHGFSVESAEALAEMWHKRVREELGIAGGDAKEMRKLFQQGYQGSRYSFGYPACPDLEEQTKIAQLLEPSRIGVELSDTFQWHPEQTTSAIIVHHPAARSYTIWSGWGLGRARPTTGVGTGSRPCGRGCELERGAAVERKPSSPGPFSRSAGGESIAGYVPGRRAGPPGVVLESGATVEGEHFADAVGGGVAGEEEAAGGGFAHIAEAAGGLEALDVGLEGAFIGG